LSALVTTLFTAAEMIPQSRFWTGFNWLSNQDLCGGSEFANCPKQLGKLAPQL
jgi:hypothetical protein